jgi:putative ABC transport system permease protein
MWNSKSNHALLIVEILVSFLVLFAVWSFVFSEYSNYVRPMGFDYKNVWILQFENKDSDVDYLIKNKTQLLNRVKSFDEVEEATINTGPLPFEGSTHSTVIKYDETAIQADYFKVGLEYPKVLNIPIKEGRWFNKGDEAAKEKTIVISQKLKEELFPNERAVGKVIYTDKKNPNSFRKIVGVIEHFKWKSDFHNPNPLFIEVSDKKEQFEILVKVKPKANTAFEANLSKSLNQMTKGWLVDIEYLSKWKSDMNKTIFIPILIMATVAGFLIFNVALGLFGILWYNINKRKEEIGLRRALGATQNNVAQQFVGEVLFIATFALVIGIFFAIQFPLLGVFSFMGLTKVAYFKAIITSSLMIYFIVVLCAFYPSWQASKLHPAMALHSE